VSPELRARNNLGGFIASDDPAAARELILAGIERARRLGERGWASALPVIYVFIGVWVGEWDETLTMIAQVEQESEATVRGGLLSLVRSWVLAGRGDRAGAQAALDEGIHLAEGISNPTGAAYMDYFTPAWFALCEGRFAEAHRGMYDGTVRSWELAEEAPWIAGVAAALAGDRDGVEASRQQRDDGGIADLHGEIALIEFEAYGLAMDGRLAEAGLLFSSAAESLRRLGFRVELGLLTIVRATYLRPFDAATLAAIDEARSIYTALGAVPLLKLLDDAVAGAGVDAGGAEAGGESSPARSTTETVPSGPG